MRENINVFNYNPPLIKYGKSIGTATLNLDEGTVHFSKEAIDNIRDNSPDGRCILNRDIFVRPILETDGLNIIDMESAEEFFSSLSKLGDSKHFRWLLDFYHKGCKTNFENDVIRLDPRTIWFLEIKKNNERLDHGIVDDIIVGCIEKQREEEYREYYLVYPSEEHQSFQKTITDSIKNDMHRLGEAVS